MLEPLDKVYAEDCRTGLVAVLEGALPLSVEDAIRGLQSHPAFMQSSRLAKYNT